MRSVVLWVWAVNPWKLFLLTLPNTLSTGPEYSSVHSLLIICWQTYTCQPQQRNHWYRRFSHSTGQHPSARRRAESDSCHAGGWLKLTVLSRFGALETHVSSHIRLAILGQQWLLWRPTTILLRHMVPVKGAKEVRGLRVPRPALQHTVGSGVVVGARIRVSETWPRSGKACVWSRAAAARLVSGQR